MGENDQHLSNCVKSRALARSRLRTLNVCGVTVLCHFVLLGLPVTLNNVREIAQRADWKHMQTCMHAAVMQTHVRTKYAHQKLRDD